MRVRYHHLNNAQHVNSCPDMPNDMSAKIQHEGMVQSLGSAESPGDCSRKTSTSGEERKQNSRAERGGIRANKRDIVLCIHPHPDQ
jgi:hypothetical protein